MLQRAAPKPVVCFWLCLACSVEVCCVEGDSLNAASCQEWSSQVRENGKCFFLESNRRAFTSRHFFRDGGGPNFAAATGWPDASNRNIHYLRRGSFHSSFMRALFATLSKAPTDVANIKKKTMSELEHKRRIFAKGFNSSIQTSLQQLIESSNNLTFHELAPFGTTYFEVAEHLCIRLGGIAQRAALDGDPTVLVWVFNVYSSYLYQLSLYLSFPLPKSPGGAPISFWQRQFFHRDLGFQRPVILKQLLLKYALRRKRMREAGVDNTLRMVEIGVDNAKNAELLLDALPTLHYIGVDPFTDNASQEQEDLRFTTALTRLMRFRNRAQLIRSTSLECSKWFRDYMFDLVFVDGDHSFSSVHSDLVAWRPKLVAGGILAGHDYSDHDPGVIVAANMYLGWHDAPSNGVLNLALDSVFFWEVS